MAFTSRFRDYDPVIYGLEEQAVSMVAMIDLFLSVMKEVLCQLIYTTFRVWYSNRLKAWKENRRAVISVNFI